MDTTIETALTNYFSLYSGDFLSNFAIAISSVMILASTVIIAKWILSIFVHKNADYFTPAHQLGGVSMWDNQIEKVAENVLIADALEKQKMNNTPLSFERMNEISSGWAKGDRLRFDTALYTADKPTLEMMILRGEVPDEYYNRFKPKVASIFGGVAPDDDIWTLQGVKGGNRTYTSKSGQTKIFNQNQNNDFIAWSNYRHIDDRGIRY